MCDFHTFALPTLPHRPVSRHQRRARYNEPYLDLYFKAEHSHIASFSQLESNVRRGRCGAQSLQQGFGLHFTCNLVIRVALNDELFLFKKSFLCVYTWDQLISPTFRLPGTPHHFDLADTRKEPSESEPTRQNKNHCDARPYLHTALAFTGADDLERRWRKSHNAYF